MKKVLSVFLAMLFLSVTTQVMAEGEVETKGKWGDKRIRSFVPAVPVVSENGGIVSIYFEDAIPELVVVITDADNQIVYQEVITEGPNSTYLLPVSLSSGTYNISITQQVYGYLFGTFVID
ncbi:DUF3244 domain-containing protein [Parabacteroides sp. PF5-9]|uniref:DUF3244 domain-containing protein n=1 Tax=Parabacteroides sp. PF5-9 TaxID=1742404 RepID=UPI002476BC27|nr:DUF3244 domain-containing protein [Parabacteroides sp. PF5-9]MDH6358999.1 hypothetical protein [Parabacteroides sp. PF5-9]